MNDKQEANGKGGHVVRHFQFTGWPNYGLPDDPVDLASFVETVSTHMARPEEREVPMVVHCSGGLGRSGFHGFLSRMVRQHCVWKCT